MRGVARVQVAVSGRGDQLDGKHPFEAEGDVRTIFQGNDETSTQPLPEVIAVRPG